MGGALSTAPVFLSAPRLLLCALSCPQLSRHTPSQPGIGGVPALWQRGVFWSAARTAGQEGSWGGHREEAGKALSRAPQVLPGTSVAFLPQR